MTPEEEAAIRERAAEYDNPDSFVGECPLQAMDDRRVLLRYVDELRAAAGRVTCALCLGTGMNGQYDPCPDCTPLRALLSPQTAPEVKP